MTLPKFEGHMKNHTNETRLALLEQAFEHQAQILLRLERTNEKIDTRLESIEKVMTSYFEKFSTKLETFSRWIMGIIISILFSMSSFFLNFYNQLHK